MPLTADEVFADGPVSNPDEPIKAQIRELLGGYETDLSNSKKPMVIVASGQSNMARLSPSSAWTRPDNLFVWNNYDLSISPAAFLTTTGTAFTAAPLNRGNPAVAFAAEAAREMPTRPVYLIDVSRGGTPIANWLSGGPIPDMYAALKANVEAALAALGLTKIDVFLWWQGENDAAAPSTYFDDYNALVSQRLQVETWFPVTTPIINFSIVGSAVNSNPIYENFQQYLQRITSHDADFRSFVNTRRLPLAQWEDTLHPTGDGYLFLGKMAYQNFTKRSGQIPIFEQGTFTPTLTFGGAAVGMTYGAVSGAYTRIGRRYFVDLTITLTAKGSSTGAAEINGLPGGAIVAPNRMVNVGRWISMTGLTGIIQGFAIANKIQLFQSGAASSAILTDASFTNTSTIQVSVNYDTN